MRFAIELSEMGSYAQTLRAVELALALDTQVGASIRCDFDGAPWRHLLSGAQQLRLRALYPGAQADHLTTNWTPNRVTNLWLRPGDALPAYPPVGAWLVATSPADPLAAEPWHRWHGRVQIVPPGAPQAPAEQTLTLPAAVCHRTFCPVLLAPAGIMVVGCGDRHADLSLIALLQAADVDPVVFFDPYQHHLATPPAGVSRLVPPCGPSQRAMAYASCRYVISAAMVCNADDHFVWEAAAMGLEVLLTPVSEVPQRVGVGAPLWNAALLRGAWVAADKAAAARPLHGTAGRGGVGDIQQQAARLAEHINQAANEKPWGLTLGRSQVVQYCGAQDVPEAKPLDEQVAYVRCGRAATWDQVAIDWLARCQYRVMFVDISENALLMGPLFACLLNHQRHNPRRLMPHVQGIDSPSRLVTLLTAHLRQQPRSGVDVVHLGDSLQRVLRTREHLRVLQQGLQNTTQSRAKAATTPPTFLVCVPKPAETARLPMGHLGSPVASESIFNGLLHDAPERFSLRWIKRFNGELDRGRTYFYPFPAADATLADELDFGQLPEVLSQGRVDLLMNSGPLITSFLAARRHWATRALPVVGLLHSIHSVQGSMDTLIQLLGPQTMPYDLFVSPSACGKAAYLQLLASASAWLEAQTGKVLTFRGDIEVLPYGIDTGWYQGLHRGACRKALGLPAHRPILLCLGRYSRREKFDLLPLLLAVRRLVAAGDQPLLLLAGSNAKSAYRDTLQEIIQELDLNDYVELRTNILGHHKPAYYGAANVFVSPSDNIQETYGLTLLEAMAAGLPVVASRWDGYRELVQDGVTGFLIATRWGQIPDGLMRLLYVAEAMDGYGHRDLHESVAIDVDALTQSLQTLLADRALACRMGEAGRQRCQMHFCISQQARQLSELLLQRVRMAQQSVWVAPQADRVPFVDAIFQRFSGYTDLFVTPDTCITLTALARDEASLKKVIKAARLGHNAEARRIHSLVTHLRHGPATVQECAAIGMDSLRVLRCLKFGIVAVQG